MPSLSIKIPKRAGEEMAIADLAADRSKALNSALQQIERSYGKDYPQVTGHWEDAIERIVRSRDRLLSVVDGLSEEDLDKRIGQSHNAELATGFSYAGSIEGLAQHNAYHAGQIRVILKMAGGI